MMINGNKVRIGIRMIGKSGKQKIMKREKKKSISKMNGILIMKNILKGTIIIKERENIDRENMREEKIIMKKEIVKVEKEKIINQEREIRGIEVS